MDDERVGNKYVPNDVVLFDPFGGIFDQFLYHGRAYIITLFLQMIGHSATSLKNE